MINIPFLWKTFREIRTEYAILVFVGPMQDDLDVHLANAEFAVNSTVNPSINVSPFEASLGYIPLNPLQLTAEQISKVPKSQRGAEFDTRHAAILLCCCEALSEAQERMRDVYDRNRVEKLYQQAESTILLKTHPICLQILLVFCRINITGLVRPLTSTSSSFYHLARQKMHDIWFANRLGLDYYELSNVLRVIDFVCTLVSLITPIVNIFSTMLFPLDTGSCFISSAILRRFYPFSIIRHCFFN